MCGIAAIFYKDRISFEDQYSCDVLSDMYKSIIHRGRDEVSFYGGKEIDVVYGRFSVTDRNKYVSSIPEHNGWKVFLNGEIYNYKELGYEGTEIEVIQQGFYEHGEGFVSRLNGMFFILAVFNNQVFLFRDRYGIKPAYYYEVNGQVIIASEIKAITKHPEFVFDVNTGVKSQWESFNNVFTTGTLFNGVKQVEKGTWLHLNSGKKTVYWKWSFQPKYMEYSYAVEKVRALVVGAVSRQIPKEVNYGTCLSSGIDSNIINACIGDAFTFSAGYKGIDNERALAELSGKKHYEIVYNEVRDFAKTIFHLEDLRVGASWPNYGLYELASKYVKVLFDGAGADELFGGYPWRYDLTRDYYSIVNRTGIDTYYSKMLFKEVFPEDSIENRYRFDADHFLPGVLSVVDKLSMAHTIEVRVPFLDNDLVDFCLTLPNEFKKNKKILKDAFADLLPEAILNQPKKGFTSPDWIPGEGNQAKKWAIAAFNEWFKIYNV
jgi:asparagine synthase (glutamine-hydrolysing)